MLIFELFIPFDTFSFHNDNGGRGGRKKEEMKRKKTKKWMRKKI